jgi:hypothetical protein
VVSGSDRDSEGAYPLPRKGCLAKECCLAALAGCSVHTAAGTSPLGARLPRRVAAPRRKLSGKLRADRQPATPPLPRATTHVRDELMVHDKKVGWCAKTKAAPPLAVRVATKPRQRSATAGGSPSSVCRWSRWLEAGRRLSGGLHLRELGELGLFRVGPVAAAAAVRRGGMACAARSSARQACWASGAPLLPIPRLVPSNSFRKRLRGALLRSHARGRRAQTRQHTPPAPAEQPRSHAQAPAKDDPQRPHPGTGTHGPGASSLRARRAGQRRIPGRN